MIVVGLIGIGALAGVVSYFALKENANFNIENDFREIKTALVEFRKDNKGLTKGIENLKKYLSPESVVDLNRYIISIDDRFLIVKKVPKTNDPIQIAKRIGGKSIYKDNVLRLGFYSAGRDAEPIAVISIKPIGNITTTTKVEYTYEKSQAAEGKILNVEWKNKKDYFETPGVHVIGLKIMDKNLKWSEWALEEIFVTEIKGVKSIIASGDHLFVANNNGTLEAYGQNGSGQLGNDTLTGSNMIRKISQIKNVDSVATSEEHTLFLKVDKTVCATGKNNNGQLGSGERNDSRVPKLTWGIENVIQVDCANGFSAALTSDGFVYTWGLNEEHCLGQGKKHFLDRPSRVEGVENVKQISLGSNYILALCHDGTIISWGDNNQGQLGLGYKSKSNDPSMAILKNVKSVVAGRSFSFAITNGNRVFGFGSNKTNQLGFEGEKEILFPQEIPNLKDINKIVTCGDFSVALDLTGNVYSWGQFTPISTKYSLVPFLSEELKYIKDIAATATLGYALAENDEIFEFQSYFEDMKKLQVVKEAELEEGIE